MNKVDLKKEVKFGLENLNKIYKSIKYISESKAEELLRIPALTYESFGYYNAIEHLILRLTKYLKIPTQSGAFSHKKTLANFNELIQTLNLSISQSTLNTILELMAFRHVATKIYGFLIDDAKLYMIVDKIKNEHGNISKMINNVLSAILNR